MIWLGILMGLIGGAILASCFWVEEAGAQYDAGWSGGWHARSELTVERRRSA